MLRLCRDNEKLNRNYYRSEYWNCGHQLRDSTALSLSLLGVYSCKRLVSFPSQPDFSHPNGFSPKSRSQCPRHKGPTISGRSKP